MQCCELGHWVYSALSCSGRPELSGRWLCCSVRVEQMQGRVSVCSHLKLCRMHAEFTFLTSCRMHSKYTFQPQLCSRSFQGHQVKCPPPFPTFFPLFCVLWPDSGPQRCGSGVHAQCAPCVPSPAALTGELLGVVSQGQVDKTLLSLLFSPLLFSSFPLFLPSYRVPPPLLHRPPVALLPSFPSSSFPLLVEVCHSPPRFFSFFMYDHVVCMQNSMIVISQKKLSLFHIQYLLGYEQLCSGDVLEIFNLVNHF